MGGPKKDRDSRLGGVSRKAQWIGRMSMMPR